MLQISEWFPNPKGTDTPNEWIELVNNGEEAVLMRGYKLQAGKKIITIPSQTIGPGEYRVLPRTQTKLTLRNTDETIILYDPTGTVLDQSTVIGSAPEGKSFSRTHSRFIFTEPTPGKQNAKPEFATLALHYPTGAPLNKPEAAHAWIFWAVFVGIGLAGAIMTIIVRNEALSNFFSTRNHEDRANAR